MFMNDDPLPDDGIRSRVPDKQAARSHMDDVGRDVSHRPRERSAAFRNAEMVPARRAEPECEGFDDARGFVLRSDEFCATSQCAPSMRAARMFSSRAFGDPSETHVLRRRDEPRAAGRRVTRGVCALSAT